MFGPPPFLGPLYPRPKLFASATSAGQTIDVPASVVAGNLLVLVDWANNNTTNPTTVVPSGFTTIHVSATTGNRKLIPSYRLADGSEASSTLTGMNGDRTNSKILLVFRGGRPPTGINISTVNDAESGNDPSPQTVAASGGATPLLVFGCYCAVPNALGVTPNIDPRTFAIGGNDAKDGELGIEITNSAVWVAWRAFYKNQTPADVTVDMEDEGSINMLQSFYLELTT